MLDKVRSTLFALKRASDYFGSEKPLGKLIKLFPEELVLNYAIPKDIPDEQRLLIANSVAKLRDNGLSLLDVFTAENLDQAIELVNLAEEITLIWRQHEKVS